MLFTKSECYSLIVAQDLCTGCGACAAICPTGSLLMKLNKKGQFIPHQIDQCTECWLCDSVCPQIHINNVDKINISNGYTEILGHSKHMGTWAGYATF